MPTIKDGLDDFIRVFGESEEFKRYQAAHLAVKQYPDKYKKLQEFRKKNYLMQNSKESVDLFAESERLMKEYEDLYYDPVVREFMDAEVAVCRIVQIVNREMITCMDLEDVLEND